MQEHALVQMVVSNMFIGAGYLLAAAYVMPRFKGMSVMTKATGIAFLALCGLLNHFELAAHLLNYGFVPQDEALSFHMVWGHNAQAIAALGFVGSISRDVARGRNPFVVGERRTAETPHHVPERRS